MLFKTVGLLMSLLTDTLIVKSFELSVKVFISSFSFKVDFQCQPRYY